MGAITWKWQIHWDFYHFTSIIWPCGRDNLKRFSCITFKSVMHVITKWLIYCHFLHFKSIIWPCGHKNDFKFNNGGGLLSSVLLFIIRLDAKFSRIISCLSSDNVDLIKFLCAMRSKLPMDKMRHTTPFLYHPQFIEQPSLGAILSNDFIKFWEPAILILLNFLIFMYLKTMQNSWTKNAIFTVFLVIILEALPGS